MIKDIIPIFVLTSLAMVGCATVGGIKPDYVAFYHPTCTPDIVLELDCLVGAWRSSEDSSTVFVFDEMDTGYELTWWIDTLDIIEAWVQPYLQGHYLLLDIYLDVVDFKWLPMPAVFMLPTHQIGRIDIVVDTLRFSLLDKHWLYTHLSAFPEGLEFEENGFGHLLVTSSTEEIQAFLKARENDLEFTELISLHRLEE